MKFVVAQFIAYAAAAFGVGVVAGMTWQRRPIARAIERSRRLERATQSSDERCVRAERERDAARTELAEARTALGAVVKIRGELADALAERQAALAARDAAEVASTQLRSDLDARVLPAFALATPGGTTTEPERDLRVEFDRERDQNLSERLELVRRNEALNASLTERLLAAERHLRDLQHRHNNYVRSAQAALTAAVIRAEQAEAGLSMARARTTPVDEAVGTVIDLRTHQPVQGPAGVL
jgi:hypothetical protein